MPYSFTQIEKEKSGVIAWVFLFLVAFYYGAAWLFYWVIKNFLLLESFHGGTRLWEYPSLNENLWIIFVASFLGIGHWWVSSLDMLPRMLTLLGAKVLSEKDSHHVMLQNIVDEVSVATGGRKISARVIPCSAMNAFALMDYDGEAVIGVTEGLLARLTRAQIEAVVGHEAAHIVSGDCLSTTTISSLFGIYDASLRGIEQAFFDDDHPFSVRPRGRFGLLMLLVYGLLLVTKFMSLLLRMFISRQKELRADAVAVRLTRDPLSLAQALYAIAYRWRGGGLAVDQLEAIFIVNPSFDAIDDEEGLWADLFSTHPPVKQRLRILLDMAKTNLKELEDSFSKTQPLPQTDVPSVPQQPTAAPPRWMACGPDGKWQGFFDALQLTAMPWFNPDVWVKKEGGDISPAYMDADLNQRLRAAKTPASPMECPRCHLPLVDMSYEGVPILGCGYCRGVLVRKNDDVQTILVRREVRIPERAQKLALMIEQEQQMRLRAQVSMKGLTLFDCPVCLPQKNQMIRKFFNMAYAVEVDQCLACEATWFDGDELEILQFLVEKHT